MGISWRCELALALSSPARGNTPERASAKEHYHCANGGSKVKSLGVSLGVTAGGESREVLITLNISGQLVRCVSIN
jgi:hypothetical protein